MDEGFIDCVVVGIRLRLQNNQDNNFKCLFFLLLFSSFFLALTLSLFLSLERFHPILLLVQPSQPLRPRVTFRDPSTRTNGGVAKNRPNYSVAKRIKNYGSLPHQDSHCLPTVSASITCVFLVQDKNLLAGLRGDFHLTLLWPSQDCTVLISAVLLAPPLL